MHHNTTLMRTFLAGLLILVLLAVVNTYPVQPTDDASLADHLLPPSTPFIVRESASIDEKDPLNKCYDERLKQDPIPFWETTIDWARRAEWLYTKYYNLSQNAKFISSACR